MIQDKPAAFLANTLQQRPLKKRIIAFAPWSSKDDQKDEYGACVLRPHPNEPLRLIYAANLPREYVCNLIETCNVQNAEVVVRKLTEEESKFNMAHIDSMNFVFESCLEMGIPMAAIRQCKYRQFFTRNLPPTDRNFKLAMKELGESYRNYDFKHVLTNKNMIEAFALAKYYEYLLTLDDYASESLGKDVWYDGSPVVSLN